MLRVESKFFWNVFRNINKIPPLVLTEPLFHEKVGCVPRYRDGEHLLCESG